ncbi:hypothetical protein F5X99DRAFT_395861 [Biscogniauxia marginata]|nr:hypothetical protein F5X99DRAFT_395861 [Biscogniauxia marginata]
MLQPKLTEIPSSLLRELPPWKPYSELSLDTNFAMLNDHMDTAVGETTMNAPSVQGFGPPNLPSHKRKSSNSGMTSRSVKRPGKIPPDDTTMRAQDAIGAETRKYRCTFCHAPFAKRFTWKRHEESVHAPQQQWICAPLGTKSREVESRSACPLCTNVYMRYPSFSSLLGECPHHFDKCWQTPVKERTFFRQDALRQHIKGVHCRSNAEITILAKLDLRNWMYAVDKEYDLTCHFCGCSNQSWAERAQHILAHFDEGITIENWNPGGPYFIGIKADSA